MKTLIVICTYNPYARQECIDYVSNTVRFYNKQTSDCDTLIVDNSDDKRVHDAFNKLDTNLHIVFGRHPVIQCFNHALKKFPWTQYYNHICYSSSDTRPMTPNDIKTLKCELSNEGVISPQVTQDACKVFEHLTVCKDQDPIVMKIPEIKNGHFYMMSKDFLRAYDYKRVDVLWGHRMEQYVGYCCAAVGLKELSSCRVLFDHALLRERDDFKFYDRPVIGTYRDFFNIIDNSHGYLGFEELYEKMKNLKEFDYVRVRNKSLYHNNIPKDREFLYNYIKDNLFINDEYYNYMRSWSSWEKNKGEAL